MNTDEEKIKKFIEITPETEVYRHISFEFGSIPAFMGYLQADLIVGSASIETLIDTVILKESGIDCSQRNEKLEKFALSQFRKKELGMEG